MNSLPSDLHEYMGNTIVLTSGRSGKLVGYGPCIVEVQFEEGREVVWREDVDYIKGLKEREE